MAAKTAKVLEYERHQTVCLPKQFRFSGSEVFMQRLGDAVMLLPKETSWQTFLNGINSFTDDFFWNGRDAEIPAVWDDL